MHTIKTEYIFFLDTSSESEEEEERRKYSLRDRRAKPAPKTSKCLFLSF